jgi:thioredoxin 1
MNFKNTSILLLLCSVLVFNCNVKQTNQTTESPVATTGIQFFEGTLNEAKAKAKAENKLIFFDAYASWCGPCKAMKKNVFPDPLVGKVFNEKYVSVAYDMEVGEGLAISSSYPVQGYPTLMFLDADGKIVGSFLGGRDASSLIALAMEVKP